MRKILILNFLCLIATAMMGQTNSVSDKNDASKKGNVQFEYPSFDFGNLNEKGGRVYHKFEFTNTGNAPVRIINVNTSCGCTSTNWIRTEVNPGENGFVNAAFDPNGRQGKFDKNLTVETSGSPTYFTLSISGTVYASKFNFADTYKYQYGNLAVKTNSITFNVKNTGYDSAEIAFYNMSNKKIYVYKIEAPLNMYITKPYDNIIPNTDLKIKVKYYPSKPLEFGPVKHEIKVYTNDDSFPVKTFYVTANIIEDFGTPDKKAMKRMPKAVFNKTTIDLGQVHLADHPAADFTITNKGKEDLIIRRVVLSCGCLSTEISSKLIPKGKTTTMKVFYSTSNLAGPDSKTLKIITNDPSQPEVTLTVNMDVIP